MTVKKVFTWKNKESWPQNWPEEIIPEESSWENVFDLFINEYSHISLYHACRPTNIESYYNNGLLISDFNKLQTETILQILSLLNIDVDPSLIKQATKTISSANNKKVCLVVDDHYLVNASSCNHYIKYGSEYITTLFNRLKLPGRNISLDDLSKIWKPTIFEAEIPLKMINKKPIYTLTREINNVIIENQIGLPMGYAYTIAFNESIDSEYIVNHYHPDID